MKYKNIILALTIISIICFVGMKYPKPNINKTTNNQSDVETTETESK